MNRIFARTDLADEASLRGGAELEGLSREELFINNTQCSLVKITDNVAAQKLGKPCGSYYTVKTEKYVNRNQNSFADTAMACAELLRRIEFVASARSVLVACLGNRVITPDALGPLCADSVIVTRHLKSSMPQELAAFNSVSVLRTGVLGTTGIESAEEIKAVCDRVRPDCVIAVDALAAGEPERLCRNIQLCDTGISPGAGVGNNRTELNSEFLGVPVAAVGVPTVIDLSAFSELESAKGMFVTPRNIDELVAGTAKLIAYSINLALHDSLSISDIDMLVE